MFMYISIKLYGIFLSLFALREGLFVRVLGYVINHSSCFLVFMSFCLEFCRAETAPWFGSAPSARIDCAFLFVLSKCTI